MRIPGKPKTVKTNWINEWEAGSKIDKAEYITDDSGAIFTEFNKYSRINSK
jgi:hypothetical protein